MARLAAKEKALYYPTPPNVVELIASNIVPAPGLILDPCCGTGEAVQLLGDRLGLVTYGNELHAGRFAEANERLTHCLNGAREFLQVEGRFNVLFNNPPYDQSLSGHRMELEHIQADFELLGLDGLGIWVLPETIFNWQLCDLLVGSLRDVKVRRFPAPEYDQFKQVVVFGKRKFETQSYLYSEASTLEREIKAGVSVLKEDEFQYDYASDWGISRFEIAFPDLGLVLADIEAEGVQVGDTWDALVVGGGQQGITNFQPVLPLSPGHTAMTIAAGIVDGTEVEIDGYQYLLKGTTEKRIERKEEISGGSGGEKTDKITTTITITEREKLVQSISALNLDNGTLLDYNSADDKDDFAQFLLTHQGALVRSVQESYPPLFVSERDMSQWSTRLERIHAPGLLPGQKVANGLLPAQQVRVTALVKKLKTDKAVVLVGECGTGKTAMSQAIMALSNSENWKTVVVCPSQIAAKWKREAEKVLREFGVQAHVIGEKRKQPDGKGKVRKVARPILDTIRAMEESNPSLLIMSYETAKMGNRWKHSPVVQKKMVKVKVSEPTIEEKYGWQRTVYVEVEKTEMVKVLTCPDCGKILANEEGLLTDTKQMGRRKWACACGCQLWQQIPFKYGGRMAVADFLNRQYPGRFNLILDECHRSKGSDTDAAYSSMDLISAAKKVVAMTGTIYGGKASSIFHLMYRLFPHFRQLYAYDDVQRFIEHHGLQETIIKETKKKGYHSYYGYERVSERTREIPGVSPGMVTMLLNNSAFIKMEDMGLVLPEYQELRHPVPLDNRLQGGLEDIESIREQAVKLLMDGKPELLSAWLYASLGWFDCPISETLEAKDEEGEVTDSFDIQGILVDKDELLAEPLAKDQALIDLVESELAQGRGVGVYFAQVNRRDWMGRIQKMLEAKGIYSEILRQSTAKPDERESWFQKFVERCEAKGQEPVLLANGNLVKEGLDLIELPTLIETGIEYRINDLRQRDRRSWRLTQAKPVKVIFLYYEDTWQETALQLVAAKLKAAHMVDGNLAEGLAAMDVDDGDLMDTLMKAVAGGMKRGRDWSGMEVAREKRRVRRVEVMKGEQLGLFEVNDG